MYHHLPSSSKKKNISGGKGKKRKERRRKKKRKKKKRKKKKWCVPAFYLLQRRSVRKRRRGSQRIVPQVDTTHSPQPLHCRRQLDHPVARELQILQIFQLAKGRRPFRFYYNSSIRQFCQQTFHSSRVRVEKERGREVLLIGVLSPRHRARMREGGGSVHNNLIFLNTKFTYKVSNSFSLRFSRRKLTQSPIDSGNDRI